MIYHVASVSSWKTALEAGFYEADSLAAEGFIHASMKDQVKGVLERYYQNKKDLVLLHIDEARLKAPLKYELASSANEQFPHIYGRLNTDAVMETTLV